ncbi:YALI0D13288p [Yarrowia lipolytica CLIB122]|uniref:YALI0D13288p n=3 Tax=Yarrowia lipolytica TaxID=4952 RepID=Q6C976_YARLI|nr:YALI0D13288p [Yarrowia lipolytica CLIB122]AOW04013.1 hypothetical protein YALI1_D16567g [Yarrowia lipolytica]KAJ8054428.1 hypothetical protein LXG23DRAFT_21759 [Yarrowia lipolytica]CAG80974.1 YALI0D13288p [Yarrowia lipolytica CLIB122]|eukprot:XP_502786.1 YALI0D13288p [Yarrowia lipolytica CLIB122]
MRQMTGPVCLCHGEQVGLFLKGTDLANLHITQQLDASLFLTRLEPKMPREQPPIPARDSGVSFNSNLSKQRSYAYLNPSVKTAAYTSSTASRHLSHSSLSSPSPVTPPKPAFSANETQPLLPLQNKIPLENLSEDQPLAYGQLVALLWPVYGQHSYLEARSRYLTQFNEGPRRKLECVPEEERPRKVRRTKSLWSILSQEDKWR